MRRTIRNAISLLLAAAVASALTVSAFAESDKPAKPGDAGKETSSVVCGSFAPITLAQAKKTALGHAGVDIAGAVFTKEKLNKAVYELSFSDPMAKYEYEISEAGGSALSCEMEIKGSHNASAESSVDCGLSYEAAVSPEEACQTALDAAGLSAESLKYMICCVSWAGHVPSAYEVKFSTRAAYYYYTIDLDSGDVLGNSGKPLRRQAEPAIF